MPRKLKILLGGIAVVLAAIVGFLALAFTSAPDAGNDAGAVSSVPIGGPFTLIDSSGKTVTDQTYHGKWMLIYFGYTFCPDACPTALNDMSVALEKLGSDADRLQLLFVTVDPKRDTPQVMAEYLKSFDRRIVGLTGSQAQIDAVAHAYRVYVVAHDSEEGRYLVDHSAYFYLMDRHGKFLNVIAGDLPGDQIASKVRQMMAHPRRRIQE